MCPSGCTYSTINAGIAGSSSGATLTVGAGTYNEDVVVNKPLTLQGAGYDTTIISGPKGGGGSTVQVAASNVTVDGFTITRDGNNTTDWNDPTLNSAGLSIQGQAITGAVITHNVFDGNRTGIDINNSNGQTVRYNSISNNRTGLIFRNQTDNTTVEHNQIKDNWTVGVVFLDASGGTNSPVQQALNSSFTDNAISGNWYGQIVDRQSGGSLPTPGTTNLKNFSGNWLGSANPAVTTANSAEPGYAGQIPVEYGGSATNPGGQPDVAGPASANFDITPLLGTATNSATYPAFQGGHGSLVVTADGAQTQSQSRPQEAVSLATADGIIRFLPGEYPVASATTIDKRLLLLGANDGVDPSDPGNRGAANPSRGPESTISVTGSTRAFNVGVPDVMISGFRFTNSGASSSNVQEPIIGAGGNFGGDAGGIYVQNNLFDGISRTAVYFNGPTPMSGGNVTNNRVDHPTRPATGCTGTTAPSGCGHQLFNLWQTNNLSFRDNVVVAEPGNGDRVRVLNVNGSNGTRIQDNLVRYSCVYTCFTIAANVDNATVTGNDVRVDVGNILQFYGPGAGSFTAGNVQVYGNTFLDTGDFAIVSDNPTADLSQVAIVRNSLAGGAFRNGSTASLVATCNWYGSASGPQGGQMTGPVTVQGWLTVNNLESTACTQRVVSPSPFDFGQVASGSSSPAQTFTVVNTYADQMADISASIQGSGYGSFSISDNTCQDQTLAIGQSCTLDVTFNATGTGLFTPKLNILSSRGTSQANLSGESTLPLTATPTLWDFGSVAVGESSAAKTFTLKNKSGSTITGITLTPGGSGKGAFPISNDGCTGSLAAGASCTFDVTLTPTGAGNWNPTITVSSSVDPATIKLHGTGLAALEANPTSKAFGTVAVGTDSPAQTFTLKNNTSSTITGLTAAIGGTGGGNYVLSANTCASTLASGATCQFDVTFHPLGVGTFSPRVIVNSSVGTQNLNLSGTGRYALEVDPASMNFGDRPVNTSSAPQTFTVTNTTDSPISSIAVTKAGSGIGTMLISDDLCTGQTLASGQTCTFVVTFRPNKAGTFKPTINVASSAPTTPVKVMGTGI